MAVGRAPAIPKVILLMGVSGCGKSTTGTRLAKAIGWPFRDADSFHPPANIDKMRSGVPLTDVDRWPWLEAIAAWIDERRLAGGEAIVSCSSLKRTYRRILVGTREDVRLVFLKGDKELIAKRLRGRRHHFMPSALLDSQFAALEEPGPDEKALVVNVAMAPNRVVERIIECLCLARLRP